MAGWASKRAWRQLIGLYLFLPIFVATPLQAQVQTAAAAEDSPSSLSQHNSLSESDDAAVSAQAPMPAADILALILPTQAAGLPGQLARRLHEGCIQGLMAVGATAQVDLYATDGSDVSTLAAYWQAVEQGAQFVIGPMQKSNVQALTAQLPHAARPTLLLQPTDDDAETANYFSLSLAVEEEIRALVGWMATRYPRVLVVGDASPLSRRQVQAFTRSWHAQNTPPQSLAHFYIANNETDWQRLFNQLREVIDIDDDDADARDIAVKKNDEPQQVIFAAGKAELIQRVRQFSPQSFIVYASSIFYAASGFDESAFLSNLRVMEMPWLLGGEQWQTLDAPLIRSRPTLQQRFYVLGLDACRISQQVAAWHEGWAFAGASGVLQLQENNFNRRGVVAQYQFGGVDVVKNL